MFSVILLWPYEDDPILEHHAPPPPSPCQGTAFKEYEVEMILDSRMFHGRLEYIVCWKGHGAANDLWLPAKDVSGAREFHRQNPGAPQGISAATYMSLPFQ
ncbi:poly protein, partial [Gautieria morchelliformis]